MCRDTHGDNEHTIRPVEVWKPSDRANQELEKEIWREVKAKETRHVTIQNPKAGKGDAGGGSG